MNMRALRWTLVASALTLGLAACTVTTDDPDDEDGGTGGSGGGDTGGSGGGDTGGTGGATGGTGGGDTGGTGGATGGSGGGSGGCSSDPSDPCSTCIATNCCDAYIACATDTFCPTALECMATCTGDPTECATQCDAGEMNVPFNDLFTCWNDNCLSECSM